MNLIAKIKYFINRQRLKTKGWLFFFVLVYLVLLVELVNIQKFEDNIWFNVYSLGIAVYILSRFLLAYFYEEPVCDINYEPTVSFVVPCKNEELFIAEVMRKMVEVNYPKEKIDLIMINDGSTDNTLSEMIQAGREIKDDLGVSVSVVNWEQNKGKSYGMLAGTKIATGEIVVFIDSDSLVDREVLIHMVKYFTNKKVASVSGHTEVYNKDKNILTRMQNIRYYVEYIAYKASEALFGNVMCTPGCCSAYRRSILLEVIDDWNEDKFLGVRRAAYADDRALTTYMLEKGYQTLYSSSALAQTIVPDSWKVFWHQQLRWNKSWILESFIAAKFMWRKNPIMSLSFYLGFILTLFAPIVALRAFVWYPLTTGQIPLFYIFGLVVIALIYGSYYYVRTKGKNWFSGVFFVIIYSFMMIYQLPLAAIKLWDVKWGTR